MPRNWTVPATVMRVVDGDTIKLDLDLGWHIRHQINCRIAGIDAPELKTPPGLRAKQFAETLLTSGDEVTFLSHSLDKYGRPLGEVFYGAMKMSNFGDDMLAAGHAIAFEKR